MKNFINLRLQYLKASSVNHNLRPNDVLVSKSQKINPDGKNYYFDFNKNTLELLERNNYEQIRKHFLTQLENDNNEFVLQRNKRRGRTINDKGAAGWVEGILSFSEAINRDLGTKYQIEDLVECAKNTMNEINKRWNTKNIGLMLHMDETTPHLHFFLKNYETEKENPKDYGVSIFAKHKTTKDLSELQDIAFREFSKLGMERGIKKIFNPKTYETIAKHYSKLEKEYRQEIFDFEQEDKNIKDTLENASKMSATQVQEKYNEIVRKKAQYKAQYKGNEDKLVIRSLNSAMRQLGHLQKAKAKIENANDVDDFSNTFKEETKIVTNNLKNISRLDIFKDEKIEEQIKKVENAAFNTYKKTHSKFQDLKNNEEKVKTLEIELKEKSHNDNLEIIKLKAQIKSNNDLYEANLTKLTQKLEKTENKLNNTDFFAENKKLEEQNKTFQTKIKEFEAKQQSYDKTLQDNKTLQEQIDEIKNKYNTLSSKYSTLESENKTLTTDNQTLKNDNETLKSENKTLTTDNQTLTTERDTYKSSSDKYEKEYENAFNTNKTLESENKRLKDAYEPEPKQETFEDFELRNQPSHTHKSRNR